MSESGITQDEIDGALMVEANVTDQPTSSSTNTVV